MAMPDDDAEFIVITGAPESVAFQKSEEFAGNLNDARNAHFLEEHKLSGEGQNLAAAPQSVASNQSEIEASKMEREECSSSSVKVDILNDSSDGGLPQTCESLPPLTSHQEEVTKDAAFEPHYQSGWNNNEIEEEVLQEETSAKGRGGVSPWENIVCNDSFDAWLPRTGVEQEDSDFARAIALSIETAEKEKAVHEILEEVELGVHDLVDKRKKTNSSRNQLEVADDLVLPRAVEEEELK